MKKVLLCLLSVLFAWSASAEDVNITFKLSGVSEGDAYLFNFIEYSYEFVQEGPGENPGGMVESEYFNWNEANESVLTFSIPENAIGIRYRIPSTMTELTGSIPLPLTSTTVVLDVAQENERVLFVVKDINGADIDFGNVMVAKAGSMDYNYLTPSQPVYLKKGASYQYFVMPNGGSDNYGITPIKTIQVTGPLTETISYENAALITFKTKPFDMPDLSLSITQANFRMWNQNFNSQGANTIEVYMLPGNYDYFLDGSILFYEDNFTVTNAASTVWIDLNNYKKLTIEGELGNAATEPEYEFYGGLMNDKGHKSIYVQHISETNTYKSEYYAPSGTYRYDIMCRHMGNDRTNYFPFTGNIELTADMVLTLPFNNYRKVNFTAQSPYTIINDRVDVFTENYGSTSVDLNYDFYIGDGTYKWMANVSDGTQVYPAINSQTFTVEGVNMTATWQINPADYVELLFTVKDHEGRYAEDAEIYVNGYSRVYTGIDGKASLKVFKGRNVDYTVIYGVYEYEGTITPKENVNNINVSFESYREISFTVEAPFLDTEYVYVNIMSTTPSSSEYEIELVKNMDNNLFEGALGLQDGNYILTVNEYSGSVNIIAKPLQFSVNSTTNSVNYSLAAYRKVTFVVNHDIPGAEYYNINLFQNGKLLSNVDSEVYLADGAYSWSAEFSEKGIVTPQQNFTVAGSDITETMNFNLNSTYPVDITITGINTDYSKSVYIYQNGADVLDVYLQASENTSQIRLPQGEYTYEINVSGYIQYTGTLTVTSGTNNIIRDYSSYKKLIFSVKDQTNNEPEDFEILLKTGETFEVVDYDADYTLYFPQGNHNLVALAPGYRSQSKTVTVASQDQNVDFILTKANVYTIMFEVEDTYGYEVSGAQITIDGKGNAATDKWGTAIFLDVETTTDLTYTITHPDFNPVYGVIPYRDIEDSEYFIGIEAIMIRRSTGLENPSEVVSFTIYPGLAQDNISILPGEGAEGVWNMQIFSVSGANVISRPVDMTVSETVNVSRLQPGVYYIHLNKNGEKAILKFIKK